MDGTEGIAGGVTLIGIWTACADAGDGDAGGVCGVCSDGVCITRVYSPGPFGTGGALCGTATGPVAMFILGGAGSGGNSGGGKDCLPPDPEKSPGGFGFGWVRKSLVNSPAGAAAGGAAEGSVGGNMAGRISGGAGGTPDSGGRTVC